MTPCVTLHDLGLLTVPEAADACGVDPATIRVWIHRYDLPTVHFGGRLHVAELAVLDCERDRRRDGRGRRRHAESRGAA